MMKQFFWLRSDGEVREIDEHGYDRHLSKDRTVSFIHTKGFGVINKSTTWKNDMIWKDVWDQIRAMMDEELKNYWGFK